ncbi:MAG: hypothetical protein JWO86_6852 [Myxococcaceae bacterium]|nr:hypothetical protein [Myxococcaceae bacterium]
MHIARKLCAPDLPQRETLASRLVRRHRGMERSRIATAERPRAEYVADRSSRERGERPAQNVLQVQRITVRDATLRDVIHRSTRIGCAEAQVVQATQRKLDDLRRRR